MRGIASAPAIVAALFIAAACGGQSAREVVDPPAQSVVPAASPSLGFPTGPAILVPPGYDPPDDRVDSTGAHLPVNGKPTLVYLEAIW